jgi:hypothetical protein
MGRVVAGSIPARPFQQGDEMSRSRPLSNDVIQNRKAAMEMVRKQAQRGCGICGAMFELESAAHAAGLGFMATTAIDWRDEDSDDEMRPY